MNVSMKVIRARLGHDHLQVLVVRINRMITPVTCVHEREEQPGQFNKSGQSHSLIAAVWMAACRVRGPRSGLAAVPGLTLPRPGRTGTAAIGAKQKDEAVQVLAQLRGAEQVGDENPPGRGPGGWGPGPASRPGTAR